MNRYLRDTQSHIKHAIFDEFRRVDERIENEVALCIFSYPSQGFESVSSEQLRQDPITIHNTTLLIYCMPGFEIRT